MTDLLPCLEFGADKQDAEFCIILMHGLGASGDDFADVAQMMVQTAAPKKWRFVLPHAPQQPVTCNGGMTMPAWYDIIDLSHPRLVNWDTVDTTQAQIEALIENESAEKIVLAGFSQGGATAYHVGLRNQQRVAGILSMSGYLLEDEQHPCPALEVDLPIGVFHGEADDVVPALAARQSIETLEANKYTNLTTQFYPGLPHSVFMDEIRDVFNWLSDL